MSENLKPCPFCGGKAKYESSIRFHSVDCDSGSCGLYVSTLNDENKASPGVTLAKKDDVIALWNSRPNEDKLQERICELEEEDINKRKYWEEQVKYWKDGSKINDEQFWSALRQLCSILGLDKDQTSMAQVIERVRELANG